MPLTVSESLALAARCRDLLSDVLETDPELSHAVRALLYDLQDSVSMRSPGGRRVTRREARRLLALSLAVIRRALVVDPSRYLAVLQAVSELASDVAAEWED